MSAVLLAFGACAFLVPTVHRVPAQSLVAHATPLRCAPRVAMLEPGEDTDALLEEYAAALAEPVPDSPTAALGEVDVSEAAAEVKKSKLTLPTLPKVDMPDVDWTEALAKAIVGAEVVTGAVKKASETVKAAEVSVQPKDAVDAIFDGAAKAKEAANAANDFAKEHEIGYKARAIFELVTDEVGKMQGKKVAASPRKTPRGLTMRKTPPAAAKSAGFSLPKVELPKVELPKMELPTIKKPAASSRGGKKAPARGQKKKQATKATKKTQIAFKFPKF